MAATPNSSRAVASCHAPRGVEMREAYHEYINEHPEELESVERLIRRSDNIEMERQERIDRKLALIQKCREEIENAKTSNKRSRRRSRGHD